jgi:hypothetical protein
LLEAEPALLGAGPALLGAGPALLGAAAALLAAGAELLLALAGAAGAAAGAEVFELDFALGLVGAGPDAEALGSSHTGPQTMVTASTAAANACSSPRCPRSLLRIRCPAFMSCSAPSTICCSAY